MSKNSFPHTFAFRIKISFYLQQLFAYLGCHSGHLRLLCRLNAEQVVERLSSIAASGFLSISSSNSGISLFIRKNPWSEEYLAHPHFFL